MDVGSVITTVLGLAQAALAAWGKGDEGAAEVELEKIRTALEVRLKALDESADALEAEFNARLKGGA